MAGVTIRRFEESDWDRVWEILEPVFRLGNTYTFPQDITKEQAHYAWIVVPKAVYVVEVEEEKGDDDYDDDDKQQRPKIIVGTYYIKPNQPGQGSHVCNCGYVVDATARGRGIASKMCEHSQKMAVDEFGFRAMQYNCVVSTNERAVKLWQRHGFDTIGRIPNGFLLPDKMGGCYVDALIMFKDLLHQE